jgi:5-(carboxyamino)imidazole ribonucleotide mutase
MDKKILVGIVMGSDSDLEVMKETAKILEKFGIGYEINIISAHRTPQKAHEYASTVEARGLEVIIAGAGGAAHLAGVIASLTPLPVTGDWCAYANAVVWWLGFSFVHSSNAFWCAGCNCSCW